MASVFKPVTVPKITGDGYYVPIMHDTEINMKTFAGHVDISGNVIDRLAAYESLCMEPEELFKVLSQYKLLPKAAVDAAAKRRLLAERWNPLG